jgi:protein kinase-like protein
MNNMDTSITKRITDDTDKPNQVRGPWLIAIRILWIAVAVAGISLYVASIPYRYDALNPDCQARACSPEDLLQVSEIQRVGLPGTFVAWYFIVVDTLGTVVYVVTGALIFWRRSDDRVALFVAFMLLATGLITGPEISYLVASNPMLQAALIVLLVMGFGFLIVFAFIFPDGRFVPRWTRWLAPVFLTGQAFVLIRDSLGAYGESPLYFGYLLAGAAIGVGSQIYRYRRISTPVQRQQTKWVMWGSVGMFTLIFIGIFPGFFNPALLASDLPYRMIRVPMSVVLASSLLPLAITFSMLRYRLWDVDFIINRSLVYGAVTLVLGGIFVGGFFGLRALLSLVLGSGQDLIAAAVPAVAVTAMFNPTRQFLRRLIDQRLYGIKLDYVKAAKAYGGPSKEATRSGDTATSFGSYSGLRLLGRGGMGEVYLAQHPALHRAVAIKILPLQLAGIEDAKKRFMREAQTVAKLRHPNIITMHDVGEQDGKAYMVMEYIEGKDLSDMLHERGRLPVDEALPILRDVAAALDYAHENGVIHRDIKPSNIMIEKVTATGSQSGARAVLMDFGIAKSLAAGTKLTQTGMIGTLDYISPEQIQGAAEVDARADIYSLGVMAYQMLAGELPFRHNNPGAMVLAHLNQPPPDPHDKVPDLPERAAAAVMQAMSKKPQERFNTAGEFVAAMTA